MHIISQILRFSLVKDKKNQSKNQNGGGGINNL
jgi:hypothetical protein